MNWRFFSKPPSPESLKIPARVPFPVDERLVARQEAARALLPEQNVKRLILENPDTWSKHLQYDEYGVIW